MNTNLPGSKKDHNKMLNSRLSLFLINLTLMQYELYINIKMIKTLINIKSILMLFYFYHI